LSAAELKTFLGEHGPKIVTISIEPYPRTAADIAFGPWGWAKQCGGLVGRDQKLKVFLTANLGTACHRAEEVAAECGPSVSDQL
jgi:hypothetical protein